MCACALIRKKWLSGVNIVKSLELVFIFKCGHSLYLNLYAQGSRQLGGWRPLRFCRAKCQWDWWAWEKWSVKFISTHTLYAQSLSPHLSMTCTPVRYVIHLFWNYNLFAKGNSNKTNKITEVETSKNEF